MKDYTDILVDDIEEDINWDDHQDIYNSYEYKLNDIINVIDIHIVIDISFEDVSSDDEPPYFNSDGHVSIRDYDIKAVTSDDEECKPNIVIDIDRVINRLHSYINN